MKSIENKQKSSGSGPAGLFVEEFCPPSLADSRQRLSRQMVKHLLQGSVESAGTKQAMKIARKGGRLAGEDFAYNHLNLQDPPEQYYRKMAQLSHDLLSFPQWELERIGATTSRLEIGFNRLGGCQGRSGENAALYCEFMKGYLLGILECYAGHPGRVSAECGGPLRGDGTKQGPVCRFKVHHDVGTQAG